MTRNVSLRAGAIFTILAVLSALIGFGSQAALAEALFLVSVPLCAVMLFFGWAMPQPAPVPVRVRSQRPRIR